MSDDGPKTDPASTGTPSAEESRALLRAARDAIRAAVTEEPPRPSELERSARLTAVGASFVTLRSPDGSLRGCIGELVARRPLVDSVRDCAVGAARRDPRFPPVLADEVDGLSIAISVLGAPKPIRPDEVEVGRHGLIVQRATQRGVLLPEVAVDNGWDAHAFLAATCRKAELPDDAWRDPRTKLSAFETRKLGPD